MPDALSNVLRTVRLTGATFFDVVAKAPWVAEQPGPEMILRRSCRVPSASEAAFNRAFKKMVGVSPSAWRRRREGVAPDVADPRITRREPLEVENIEQPHLEAASHRR